MTSNNSPPRDDAHTLLHQTTVALSQIHNLLRQATDIMAHLHTRFLHHIRQADPTFRRHFQQLPPPPTYSINLPSPTSSCDSAPSRPRARPPPPPPNHSDDTPSPSPPPQLRPARKRKQPPPPPLNPQADWDTWDGDADCRLVELKSNPKLRPNWTFVARRVGFSVEQCQARWKELKDLQKLQDNKPPQSASPPADLENWHHHHHHHHLGSPLRTTSHLLLHPRPTHHHHHHRPTFHPLQRQPLDPHTTCRHMKLHHCSWLRSERLVRTGIRNHMRTRQSAVI